MMEAPRKAPASRLAGLRSRRAILLYLAVGAFALGYYFWPATEDNRFLATFAATRGDLEITVIEGGSLEAQEKVELKSEVEGQTKILYLVEEGYFVTPEDVESMKVLVELDATDIRERQTQQELQYQNTYAAYAQAREQYAIQINQSESDIIEGELAVKFARMDFERYVGADVAKEIIAKVDDARSAEPEPVDDSGPPKAVSSEAETPLPVAAAAAPPAPSENPLSTSDNAVNEKLGKLSVQLNTTRWPQIDFAAYADVARLGNGEAGQKLRKLEDDLVLNQKEKVISESKLDGTKRLFTKEFVTKNDLEQDEMALRRNTIQVDSAEVSKELFLRYEFNKMAEKLLSDYGQALSKLERLRQSAVSKLAQAEAQLRSAEANFDLQGQQRKKLREQIEKCTLRATKPGLVVYGGGNDRWWDGERIEEGASVRERQVMITIPDTTRMAVKANIHEAYVKLVKKGQKVRVRADSNRDLLLDGEVVKIAVLPNSENRWMSPDLKVYETEVNILGSHDWLKPGMSAQVEIVAGVLKDIVYVPLQAVFNEDGQRVVYISGLTGQGRRVVETGEFNDSYIEVKKGIEPGEVVLLRAPENEGGNTDKDKDKEKKKKSAEPAAGAA